MLNVTLYHRPECHLCEQARSDLRSLQADTPHRLVEVDISGDEKLLRQFGQQIPVIEVGPYRLRAPFSRTELMMTLSAARDSRGQIDRLSQEPAPPRPLNAADSFSLWVARHWLALVLLLFAIYVGLPFLAPVLMKNGAKTPANIIYTAYSPLCHELAFRSFFLFGPQAYYPRAAAGVPGAVTYGEATGQDEADLLTARNYKGSEEVGYKVALCQRDVAIYLAILVFGILYALTGRRLPPLHWALWLLIAIAPLGLDGFSQLISQLGIPFLSDLLPYRESTPLLRTLTGFLFGFGTAWFGLPYMEESMRETRDMLEYRFAKQGKPA